MYRVGAARNAPAETRRLRITHARGHRRSAPTRAAPGRAALSRMPVHGTQWMLVWIDDWSVDRMDVERPLGGGL